MIATELFYSVVFTLVDGIIDKSISEEGRQKVKKAMDEIKQMDRDERRKAFGIRLPGDLGEGMEEGTRRRNVNN